ncbi:MAG: 5-oxoprolinase subunit PxpA [Halioglobus sp.]|nr:5-oxoprolinase subunit PxpA [Halioglobus sp.]
MLLNCDLGERASSDGLEIDAAVMPFIDQASIACGFHAGDPLTMQRTLALAAQHGVAVGAHPAYHDREGFGRRSLQLGAEDIAAHLHYQIGALAGIASSMGLCLSYVKPHGALYHDMMQQPTVRRAILETIATLHPPLTLMLQSNAAADALQAEASTAGVNLCFEAFADRRYDDNGKLLPREEPGAILAGEAMLAQVEQLAESSSVTSVSGRVLDLRVDTLCVHGDNPEAVRAIAAIRSRIERD